MITAKQAKIMANGRYEAWAKDKRTEIDRLITEACLRGEYEIVVPAYYEPDLEHKLLNGYRSRGFTVRQGTGSPYHTYINWA